MTTTPGQELLDLFAAAHRLRSAIRESGLTKSEVARRAGVSRSRLDAYLKAESQPSFPVMNRIFRATGVEAALDVKPIDRSLQQVAARVAGETGASAEDLEEQYVAELVAW